MLSLLLMLLLLLLSLLCPAAFRFIHTTSASSDFMLVQTVRQVAQMLLCGPTSFGVFLRVARAIPEAGAAGGDGDDGAHCSCYRVSRVIMLISGAVCLMADIRIVCLTGAPSVLSSPTAGAVCSLTFKCIIFYYCYFFFSLLFSIALPPRSRSSGVNS